MISTNNISFSYDGKTPTLNNLSLGARKGEFLTLVGPNGSGKSTLLRLLDCILLPAKGSITLDGIDITEFTRAEIARRIAFVPQDGSSTLPFSVTEMVLMGRSPYVKGAFFENETDRAIARDMMVQMDISHLAESAITSLSGGERQRVFIARAMTQQPQVVLLDEPNAHLDVAHQIDVFNILHTLKQSGLTVVAVTHDLNLAAAFSDRIGMLLSGSLVALGTPAEVLTEQSIHNVFRTRVIVDRHPSESTPRVTLRSFH